MGRSKSDSNKNSGGRDRGIGPKPWKRQRKEQVNQSAYDTRRQALGAAHLVRGPVRLIHHKNLKHPHTLCKLVNAAASATRVVVGATACAMHDVNQIRVHEISDGSPWLAGD